MKNITKYRMVLGGLLITQYTPEVINCLIREWMQASSARAVASGVIHAERNRAEDVVVYTAYFDSSYWTGLDFKGFK